MTLMIDDRVIAALLWLACLVPPRPFLILTAVCCVVVEKWISHLYTGIIPQFRQASLAFSYIRVH